MAIVRARYRPPEVATAMAAAAAPNTHSNGIELVSLMDYFISQRLYKDWFVDGLFY